MMDRRKNSWDSKVSVSTVSTAGTRQYRRSPSSILSSDSDIRFTRKKLTSQYRFGCCIIASFLCLLLAAAAAVYVGYTFFVPNIPDEEVFRAMFRVVDGDTYTPEMADLNSTVFKVRSRDYKERLNLLFRRSSIKHGYIGSEVLALDGTENRDLIVHFNVRVDPLYASVDAKAIEAILANEISVEESLFFQNITIDANSLEVRPTELLLQMTTSTMPTTAVSQAITQTPPPPRRCSPLQLPYCSQMPYNITTYPNIFQHKNAKEVKDDVIAFRELVDAECYRHAYDFVCQVLQPACKRGDDEDDMILPCRNFCKDFLAGCGGRLSEKFKELLDCNRFPEFGGGKFCFPKPGCVEELKARALSPRICDGVVDCQDLTDEKSCTYCPRNQIHCGIGRVCIHQSRRCDGRTDCPDGSDERGCLSLTPNVETVKKTPTMTPHSPIFHSEGYVMYNERGEIGKLCTESLNRTLRRNKTEEILNTVAASLCKTLSFSRVKNVQVMRDTETNVPYVSMKDPTAAEITFIRSSCPTKEVLHVSCSNLECGLQSTHGEDGLKSLSKMSAHGDWPWHVALFKEDVHICDGTLVADDWVVTTTSCFQGQPKAEWSVRLGVVRLTSSSPWEQERRIVGMVKSPVEGSTIALVKLDEPVTLNDFVRPICLTNDNTLLKKKEVQCNTLGWARNREQLQRIQVKQIEMEKCENVSISNVNSFCAETIYGKDDCNEEEFAGSPIVCLNGNRWTLMGLTNWRIACASNGMMRPRMYDKIFSNVEWIKETLSETAES